MFQRKRSRNSKVKRDVILLWKHSHAWQMR
ncbi:hypothetical protein [Caudoviricetes sp.]|nr:hypothetical protein [Caudoviricetes sp.]